MGDPLQIYLIKYNTNNWNIWRRNNPDISINLNYLQLNEHDLSHLNLDGASLIGATLRGSNLKQTSLKGANLQSADLSTANFEKSDLSRAHLWLANISEANLQEANLNRSILKESKIKRANLHNCNLYGADLTNTDLEHSHLRGAILASANLTQTNLISTNLFETDFSSAIFNEAMIGDCIIGSTDFSSTTGLNTIRHYGRSTLSIDTIIKSKGKIPETFMRGCGLNDLQIEFFKLAKSGLSPDEVTDITYKIHQLYLGEGIKYYSCFISYNNRDTEFAEQLYKDLQNRGVRCWFAPEDMKIGDKIRPKIDQEIRLRDKLLVILSENSVKSEWVGDEVESALEEESKSSRSVLFPIRLDDEVMNARNDWAAKIKRKRHIGDFTNWKDKTSYQNAFERLMRDLKATGGQDNGE